jgi:transcriptional regulator with XRE-family HTH domain
VDNVESHHFVIRWSRAEDVGDWSTITKATGDGMGVSGDQELACRLKELRKHANISLAELAAAIGFTKATIWRYEHGQRRVLRLDEIARALYCDEQHLHMPAGSPLPRLSIRPRRPTAPTDSRVPLYRRIVGDEPAFSD